MRIGIERRHAGEAAPRHLGATDGINIMHTALRMTLRCLQTVMRKIAIVLIVTGHFQFLSFARKTY